MVEAMPPMYLIPTQRHPHLSRNVTFIGQKRGPWAQRALAVPEEKG